MLQREGGEGEEEEGMRGRGQERGGGDERKRTRNGRYIERGRRGMRRGSDEE